MKKNDECKLIQDLLPNYIEKLTSEETNTYIENHIKDCKDCTKILKDMGEEVTLDKIDEMKKVDYLKKIKFRNRSIIGILLAILLILSAIIIIFLNSIGGIALDENGNPKYFEAFKEWITGENRIITSKVTNLLITSNEERKITMILTFNDKDICIGARYCVGGYTEQEVLEKYEEFKSAETHEIPAITNVKINEDKIIYNYNYWNGKTKEEVMQELSKNKDYIIQEI